MPSPGRFGGLKGHPRSSASGWSSDLRGRSCLLTDSAADTTPFPREIKTTIGRTAFFLQQIATIPGTHFHVHPTSSVPYRIREVKGLTAANETVQTPIFSLACLPRIRRNTLFQFNLGSGQRPAQSLPETSDSGPDRLTARPPCQLLSLADAAGCDDPNPQRQQGTNRQQLTPSDRHLPQQACLEESNPSLESRLELLEPTDLVVIRVSPVTGSSSLGILSVTTSFVCCIASCQSCNPVQRRSILPFVFSQCVVLFATPQRAPRSGRSTLVPRTESSGNCGRMPQSLWGIGVLRLWRSLQWHTYSAYC